MKNKNHVFTVGRRMELDKVIFEMRNVRKVTEFIHNEFMEDGKAVIHVNVDELYNPLSMGNLRQLNGDIYEYIEDTANLLPSMIPLRVILHGVDEKERENVKNLFRFHYQADMQDRLWDYRLNNTKTVYLAVIGLVLILAYLFYALLYDDSLLLQVLSIIGSFALCEAAGCFMLDRRSIKDSMYETAQFLTAEIGFDGAGDPDPAD